MSERPRQDTDDLTLVVTRDFDAPPERVFDAWLDPGAAGCWLFATPDGVMETVEIDPRVGGAFRIAERRGEELADHFGEYLEIDRPRRLEFSFATSFDATPTRVTVEIEAREGGCTLTLTHRIAPAWADYLEQARSGWTMILDNLGASLDGSAEIVITREFDAPRELVWRAWTEPEHLARWFGPRGFSTRVEEMDVRPGGASRLVMIGPDGTEYPSLGVYQEVVPQERIVTTCEFGEDFELPGHAELPRGIVQTSLFEDLGGRTRVTIRIAHPTAEDKRRHEEMGVVAGWNSSLDCLAEHLAAVV